MKILENIENDFKLKSFNDLKAKYFKHNLRFHNY